MTNRMLCLGLLALASVALVGCTDSKAVNAAFSQTRVSWFLFDPEYAQGLVALAGLEQSQRVEWKPRNRAVYATDSMAVSPSQGALAVSGLGLLLVDDGDGRLTPIRPLAQVPLHPYRTGRLFLWKEKLFVTLYQEPPFALPPASLAWWAVGQSRLAFYPIPSQVNQPARQVVEAFPPEGDVLGLLWKRPTEAGWLFESGTLDLEHGVEGTAPIPTVTPLPLSEDFATVRARLADRLGADVTAYPVRASGALLLFTETGWVAVARLGDPQSRLYRLPDLGLAGRYTGAVALQRGVLFTWEFAHRGYVGAAGLVHVPFAILAP